MGLHWQGQCISQKWRALLSQPWTPCNLLLMQLTSAVHAHSQAVFLSPYSHSSFLPPSSGLQSGKMKLPHPEGCPSKLYKVMQRCWAPSPKDRPSFSEIANMLGESPSESKAWAGKHWPLVARVGIGQNLVLTLDCYRLSDGTHKPKGTMNFYTNGQMDIVPLPEASLSGPVPLCLTRLCFSRFLPPISTGLLNIQEMQGVLGATTGQFHSGKSVADLGTSLSWHIPSIFVL